MTIFLQQRTLDEIHQRFDYNVFLSKIIIIQFILNEQGTPMFDFDFSHQVSHGSFRLSDLIQSRNESTVNG